MDSSFELRRGELSVGDIWANQALGKVEQTPTSIALRIPALLALLRTPYRHLCSNAMV